MSIREALTNALNLLNGIKTEGPEQGERLAQAYRLVETARDSIKAETPFQPEEKPAE